MRHWILQANPRRYRLLDALRDSYEISSWSIAHLREEIAPGGEFALWLSGEERGVYALGVVTEPAEYRPDDDDPYWTDPADASTPRLHVGIRLRQSLIDRPVLGEDLAEDPRFANALILRMPGGRNPFRLTGSRTVFDQCVALASALHHVGDGDVEVAVVRVHRDIADRNAARRREARQDGAAGGVQAEQRVEGADPHRAGGPAATATPGEQAPVTLGRRSDRMTARLRRLTWVTTG